MSDRPAQDEIHRLLLARLATDASQHVAILDATTYSSPTDPPDGLGIDRERLIDVIEALGLVIEEDRGILFEHLPRAEAAGTARDAVRLVNGMTADAAFFDLVERFGCWVAVITEEHPTEEGAPGPALSGAAARVARFQVDSLGALLTLSPSFTSMLGWTKDAMAEFGALEMIHLDERGAVLTAWGSMMTGPEGVGRVRARIRRADGDLQWVEMMFENHLGADDCGTVDVEVVDIQAEMAAVESLRAREQLLHRLAEVLPVGVVQIDAEQRIVYANAAMTGITGRDAAVIFADHVQDVIEVDRGRASNAIEQVLRTGVDGDVEVTIEHKVTGERRVCGISVRALVEDNGTVPGAIVCVIDVTDSASRRHELEVAATFDPLTGAYNRPSCLAALEAALKRPLGPTLGAAVIFVDLDDFKDVNDAHGHLIGDELLIETAERLRAVTRTSDVVGRYGGDEFIVVCPDGIEAAAAAALASRIYDRLRSPFEVVGRSIEPTASVGVAWSPGNVDTVHDLVERADAAMYHAKRSGLDGAHLWTPGTGTVDGVVPH